MLLSYHQKIAYVSIYCHYNFFTILGIRNLIFHFSFDILVVLADNLLLPLALILMLHNVHIFSCIAFYGHISDIVKHFNCMFMQF